MPKHSAKDWRKIESKYTTNCRGCGTLYYKGEPIFWCAGVGALCETCGNKEVFRDVNRKVAR